MKYKYLTSASDGELVLKINVEANAGWTLVQVTTSRSGEYLAILSKKKWWKF